MHTQHHSFVRAHARSHEERRLPASAARVTAEEAIRRSRPEGERLDGTGLPRVASEGLTSGARTPNARHPARAASSGDVGLVHRRGSAGRLAGLIGLVGPSSGKSAALEVAQPRLLGLVGGVFAEPRHLPARAPARSRFRCSQAGPACDHCRWPLAPAAWVRRRPERSFLGQLAELNLSLPLPSW